MQVNGKPFVCWNSHQYRSHFDKATTLLTSLDAFVDNAEINLEPRSKYDSVYVFHNSPIIKLGRGRCYTYQLGFQGNFSTDDMVTQLVVYQHSCVQNRLGWFHRVVGVIYKWVQIQDIMKCIGQSWRGTAKEASVYHEIPRPSVATDSSADVCPSSHREENLV